MDFEAMPKIAGSSPATAAPVRRFVAGVFSEFMIG